MLSARFFALAFLPQNRKPEEHNSDSTDKQDTSTHQIIYIMADGTNKTLEMLIKGSLEFMEKSKVVISAVSQDTEPRRFVSFVVAAVCNGAKTVIAVAKGFACGNLFNAVELAREVRCVSGSYRLDWIVASRNDRSGVECIAMGPVTQNNQSK